MLGLAQHCFVVPAYGRSPHLQDCLASLAAQTLPSPVVVSTSTPYEGLSALAERFGARCVVHTGNHGIGYDWNVAVSHADARWVTIAHQDDVYLPDFAERTMRLARSRPDVALVMTGYSEWLDGRVRGMSAMLAVKRVLLELGFVGREAIASTGAKRRVLMFGCPVPCPSVTVDVHATGLRFREDLRVNLDWDAWLRLAMAEGAFAYDRRRLMLHRIHSGSETSAGIRDGVRAGEDLMMFQSLWPAPVARLLARGYALSYDRGGQ